MNFRTDIHGLRGVAILLVVAYHVHFSAFSGGFVGVDVFFVLSGYLITGLLFQEFNATGHIKLVEFYARRARRLLPASAIVLTATILTAILLLSPLEQFGLARSGLATALYVSNLFFLREATDYLAAPPEHNPFLHTWSLAVEEQLYLVWPAVIVLFVTVLKDRRACIAAIAAVAAVSFLLNVWLTGFAQPWAFFGPPARVWEFAFGALAGLVPITIRSGRQAILEVCTATGLVMVVGSAMAFGRHTIFPGVAALVPVAGTMLVLACGSESRIASALLRARPLQWFGDVSYLWYLWHWPVLVFADVLLPGLTVAGRVGFGLVSLVISAATRGLLEDRIRFAPWLVARPAMTLGLTAVLTLALATGTASWRAGAGRASASAAHARFSEARADLPVLYENGCHLAYQPVTSPECVFGDSRSATTVVLFGDSHAAHWFPVLERIASDARWRLIALTKSGCPSVDVALSDVRIGRRYVECEAWRLNSLARIELLRPSLVVLANAHDYLDPSSTDTLAPIARPPNDGAELAIARTAADWSEGLRRTLHVLGEFGLQTVVLRDSPSPGFDVPTCLARQAWRPQLYSGGCRFTKSLRSRPDIDQAEAQAVAASRNASVVDIVSAICKDEACDTIRGGVIMYRDDRHLTTRFSATLRPVLEVSLRRHLARFDPTITPREY